MNTNNQKILKLILEFRLTFQQPIARSISEYVPDQVLLYRNLIAEEHQEYRDAKGREEILDALGDLTYVIFGAVASTGIQPLAYRGTHLKACPAYKPHLHSILPLVEELSYAMISYLKLHDKLTAAYHEMEQTAAVQGVRLYPLVQEIHSSNMSKLWKEDELDDTTTNMTVIPTLNNLYIVKRKRDGKIVKSPSYRPPDLSRF